MTDDLAFLDEEPACVGRARMIDGCDVAAWIIPSMTWRGSPRWKPKLERKFVTWRTFWNGRRYRSFEKAKARALTVLARVDADHGRREYP